MSQTLSLALLGLFVPTSVALAQADPADVDHQGWNEYSCSFIGDTEICHTLHAEGTRVETPSGNVIWATKTFEEFEFYVDGEFSDSTYVEDRTVKVLKQGDLAVWHQSFQVGTYYPADDACTYYVATMTWWLDPDGNLVYDEVFEESHTGQGHCK